MNNLFYGFNVIKNLLKYKYNCVKEIYMVNFKNNLRFNKIKYLSNKYFIKINLVNKNYFNFLNNKYINHQNIIAYINKKLFNFNIEKFLNLLKKNNNKSLFFLILDSINDPYNLGSCIRTAVGLGVNCIIISKYNSVSIYNNIVHKSSSGSIYKIFLLQFNILKIINLLLEYNFYIIGTCLKTNNFLFNFNLNRYKKIALILGSESNGLKKNIKSKCNILFKIPIIKINSLNVSVANGIFLYQLLLKSNF